MGEILTLPKLVSEEEAYALYGNVLEDKELRRARSEGRIGFHKPKNKILYREDELLAYVKARLEESYHPCQTTNSASENTGSTPSLKAEATTVSGMTPELARLGAEHLRREISSKPKSRSQRPS